MGSHPDNMLTTEQRPTDVLTARRLRSRSAVVGVDGGGSKTHAVVVDVDGRVMGEGTSGASNPLRVGVTRAAAAVREAIDKLRSGPSPQRRYPGSGNRFGGCPPHELRDAFAKREQPWDCRRWKLSAMRISHFTVRR